MADLGTCVNKICETKDKLVAWFNPPQVTLSAWLDTQRAWLAGNFSANTGLTADNLINNNLVNVNNGSEIKDAYDQVAMGGAISFNALTNIYMDNTMERNISVALFGNNNNISFKNLSGNTPNMGSYMHGDCTKLFFNCNIYSEQEQPVDAFTGHMRVLYSNLNVTVVDSTINLGNIPLFSTLPGHEGDLFVGLNNVTIRKAQPGSTGHLLKTFGVMRATIKRRNVVLDGVTWSDIVDDLSTVTFID